MEFVDFVRKLLPVQVEPKSKYQTAGKTRAPDNEQYEEGTEMYYIQMFRYMVLYDYEKDHYIVQVGNTEKGDIITQILSQHLLDCIPITLNNYKTFGEFLKKNKLFFIKPSQVKLVQHHLLAKTLGI